MEEKIRFELIEFLQEAKKRTFASRVSIPLPHFDGSKEYIYRSGNWTYKDKYFGSVVDTGQELVFYKRNLLWSMSYRGGMIEGSKSLTRRCFSFLKDCLRHTPENFPVRGPAVCSGGDFRYENTWKGDLEDFVGEEKIFWRGVQIYFRDYFGGTGDLRKIPC